MIHFYISLLKTQNSKRSTALRFLKIFSIYVSEYFLPSIHRVPLKAGAYSPSMPLLVLSYFHFVFSPCHVLSKFLRALLQLTNSLCISPEFIPPSKFLFISRMSIFSYLPLVLYLSISDTGFLESLSMNLCFYLPPNALNEVFDGTIKLISPAVNNTCFHFDVDG